jgi:hypothetical protein
MELEALESAIVMLNCVNNYLAEPESITAAMIKEGLASRVESLFEAYCSIFA